MLVGCGAQSENFDDRDWTKQHGDQSAAWREVETLFGASESDADRFEHSLRGVRHDLTLRTKADPDTRCTCVDVGIGLPNDQRFAWAGKRPLIDPQNMIIALRTQGSECPTALTKRRPSIQAVDVKGADVTVVIEELTYDRPQALGAIIRKPGPSGRLFVRSRKYRNQKLPYARQVSGKSLCRVETSQSSHHQQIRSGRRY